MKSVTVMSGPAIRKLKADNARLREQKRRLRRVLDEAGALKKQPYFYGNTDSLDLAIAAAREVLD